MQFGDIRDEWKINEIERKVDDAVRRIYELDSLRRDVDRLEHSNRELSSMVDGLRDELQEAQRRIETLELTGNE